MKKNAYLKVFGLIGALMLALATGSPAQAECYKTHSSIVYCGNGGPSSGGGCYDQSITYKGYCQDDPWNTGGQRGNTKWTRICHGCDSDDWIEEFDPNTSCPCGS